MPRRRAAAPAPASLDALFRPRSVAVIGASRQPHSIGRELLRNLIDCGFEGKVFPVNPKADFISSIKCWPRIGAIPDPVDLAVLVIPAALVPAVARDCGRKGVRGLVVISAGFREIGPAGARLEAALMQEVRRHRMRLVGPNCMGIINTDPAVALNASFAANRPIRGRAAFVSQSGALGEAILSDARNMGIGISMFASIGNRPDVSPNDLVAWWRDDPGTGLILMYIESFGNPRNFVQVARSTSRRKPLIAVKAGRSERGARAASSHTGSLAGREEAVTSFLDQCGVIRVGTMRELFTVASALANQPLPQGDRVLIVGNAGGPNILATDACAGAGLRFAELLPKTKAALRRALPPEASAENPVDLIASADGPRYDAALRILFQDPTWDAALVLFVSPINIDALEVARAITRRAAETGGRPVLVVSLGKARDEEAIVELRSHGLPSYRFPEEAALALAAMVRYRRIRERPEGRVPDPRRQPARAARVLEAARRGRRRLLLPTEAAEVLEAYGIPVAPARLVSTAEGAIAAAHALGYPVVLKAVAEKIVHKTEVGGVRLDLRNADDVARAFAELGRLRSQAPELRVLVQPHLRGGAETILGAYRDPEYGPLISFGLGGIFAEALGDVQLRVAPLTDHDAREMVRGLKAFRVLQGERGQPPADLAALEDALLRLSTLIVEQEAIAELDLNPFLAAPAGGRSLALDARILRG